jgi:hypothetical protein
MLLLYIESSATSADKPEMFPEFSGPAEQWSAPGPNRPLASGGISRRRDACGCCTAAIEAGRLFASGVLTRAARRENCVMSTHTSCVMGKRSTSCLRSSSSVKCCMPSACTWILTFYSSPSVSGGDQAVTTCGTSDGGERVGLRRPSKLLQVLIGAGRGA